MVQTIVGWEDVAGDDIVGGEAAKLPQSIVGSVPVTVGASLPATISIPVQRNLRPDRIFIDRVQAASLLVTSFSIGTVNLFLSGGSVPADMFSPDAQGAQIRALETATPSVGITIGVLNKTAVAITNFAIGILGPSEKAA